MSWPDWLLDKKDPHGERQLVGDQVKNIYKSILGERRKKINGKIDQGFNA